MSLDHIEIKYDGHGERTGWPRSVVNFFTDRSDVKIALYDEAIVDIAERFARYAHGRLRPCSVSSPHHDPQHGHGCVSVCVAMPATNHAIVGRAIDRVLGLMAKS